MQNLENERLCLPQTFKRLNLIFEEGGSLPRIGDRAVDALSDQLVVLDQGVVGILWKADRRQHQRVDDGQPEERQVRRTLTQQRQIMPNQVVAEKAISSGG